MPTTVVIPPPIRADVDEAVSPHVFDEVTSEPFDLPVWNDRGELEVTFPTVDLTTEQYGEVIRIARAQPMYFDPGGPQLPAPIIPGVIVGPDGELIWTGGQYIDQLKSGYLNADMAVAGKLWVAQWADPTDADSGPAENSAVIEMIPGGRSEADDSQPEPGGFSVWSPEIDPVTGTFVYVQSDPDDPTSPLVQSRRRTVHFPAAEYIYNETTGTYDHVAATFDGDVTARTLKVDGELTINSTAHLASSATIQLDNTVTAPVNAPVVSFGPKARRWPASETFIEIGSGHSGNFMVTGRLDKDNNGDFYHVRARFINPDTGFLDHDFELSLSMKRVAGFTCTGGYFYLLCKFASASEPWRIVRFDSAGFYTGHFVNVNSLMGGGYNTGGLGDCNRDNVVGFAFRDNNDELSVRYYTLGLENHTGYTNRNNLGVNTARAIVGVPEVDVIAAGDRFFWFEGTTYTPARSWNTGVGAMNSAEYLAGTGFVSTHGNGTLSVFNDSMPTSPWLWLSQTYGRTTPLPVAETNQSDKLQIRWPTRKFATVQVASRAPGSTGTYLYAGTGSTEPGVGAMWRVGKPVQAVQVIMSAIPASGTNPPVVSTFNPDDPNATPSELRSQVTIPGTTRSAARVRANGFAELYGLVQPFVSRYRDSDYGIPNAAQTTLAFVSERETHSDIVWNNGEFALANAGRYFIICQASWDAATGGYRTVQVQVNGANRITGRATGGSYTATIANRTLRLAAGDRVSVAVYQNSGNQLKVRGGENETYIEITRLGA